MKMDLVAGSKNDEFYTPPYAIRPILKFIPRDWRVWCPFDGPDSNFVRLFRKRGNSVIHSHIEDGRDFFKWKPKIRHHVIVSNPPYSLKNEVFDRLFQLGKPFAMLVGVVGLFESQFRFEMFAKNSFEVMYLSKRISYFKDYSDPKPSINPPFSSVYITHNLLPKQIMFETVCK